MHASQVIILEGSATGALILVLANDKALARCSSDFLCSCFLFALLSCAGDGAPPYEDVVGPAQIPATQGSLVIGIEPQVQGTSKGPVSSVRVDETGVTLTIDGAEHTGVLYGAESWAGYDWYFIVSVAADGKNLARTALACSGGWLVLLFEENLTALPSEVLAMGRAPPPGSFGPSR